MELIIKRNRRGEGKTLMAFELGNYEVSVITYDRGWRSIVVSAVGSSRYQPAIYTRDDMDGNILGFNIQTTSYGSLPMEEIRKVVAGYEEAIKAVEILTKEFVKEEQHEKNN